MLPLDSRTTLVVVDVQKGILAMPPKEVADQLVEANVTLADAFHAAGLPVVWVHATGLPPGRVERPIPEGDELPEWFADLDGRLPAREGDLHIDEPRTISAFSRTDLAEKLRAEGVTQVVFTGIAMGAGVEASARSAFDEDFTVTVVSDAVVDGDPERQRASLGHDIPSVGGLATVAEVVADLAKR